MRHLAINFIAPPLAGFALLLAGCASGPPPGAPPLTLVQNVDLQRFMGDWYVIAAIPTSLEKGAYNAKEHYSLDADGTVPTVFSFNADGYDGARKTYESRGYVVPGTGNAVWGQQYIWPIKADYRIGYVAPDYSATVITRERRDYVWIMSRTPTMPAAVLARLTAFVGTQGYETAKLEPMPQASGK